MTTSLPARVAFGCSGEVCCAPAPAVLVVLPVVVSDGVRVSLRACMFAQYVSDPAFTLCCVRVR